MDRHAYHLRGPIGPQGGYDKTVTTQLAIPAPPPTNLASHSLKVASRVIAGAAFGAMSGQAMNGAALGMMTTGKTSALLLNDKIKVPAVCHACGTNEGTKQKVVSNHLVMGPISGIDTDSKGRTRVELGVPFCDDCADLDASALVTIHEYAKDGDGWRITLLVANRAAAEQYGKANPGTVESRAGVLTEATPHDLWVAISQDGKRRVHLEQGGDKWTVVEDERKGGPYDGILLRSPAILFSNDSRRVAYGALVGDQWMMVVDGVEGKLYDAILPSSIAFSPDGRLLAYVARARDKWTVVIEGTEDGSYQGVLAREPIILFSPDNRRVAYGAQAGGKWAVVVDGERGKGYDSVHGASMTFSPDSQHIAYRATVGGKWTVVVDGTQLGAYEYFMDSQLRFGPDSMHIAYVAGNRDRMMGGVKWMLHLDGRECRRVGTEGSIVFSPDGGSVDYVVRAPVDGKPGARW